MSTHQLEEPMALNHPAGPVQPWGVRVRAEVIVKEEEDGSRVEAFGTLHSKGTKIQLCFCSQCLGN